MTDYKYVLPMGEKTYGLSNGITITDTELKAVAKTVVKTIHDELPDRERRVDVAKLVLKYAKKELDTLRISVS